MRKIFSFCRFVQGKFFLECKFLHFKLVVKAFINMKYLFAVSISHCADQGLQNKIFFLRGHMFFLLGTSAKLNAVCVCISLNKISFYANLHFVNIYKT